MPRFSALLRFFVCLATFATTLALRAAEWQWSAEMRGLVSPETNAAPRAFLWIPTDCARVRGIVVAQHNMEEEPILEHATFRATLRELGFAAIWITPPFDLVFQFEDGAGEHIDRVLRDLAERSGYSEIALAPLIPLGHSAAASFPWNVARWAPQRTLAVISLSGQWPLPAEEGVPLQPDPRLDGIPGLVTLGEYEWADERTALGLKQRAAQPQIPLTMLAEPAGGHFEVSAEKVAYLALYLRKAAAFRLPPINDKAPLGAPTALRPIDATTDGWLVDRWRFDEPARVPASPLSEYPEPEDAFWCFDREHAIVTEKFGRQHHGKRATLVGFTQNGTVLPQDQRTHQQVTIPWLPIDDGLTFKLSGAFLETVPAGRPERWTGQKAGTAVALPKAASAAISIDRICGPVEKLSADTFALRFSRMGMTNQRRSGEIWLTATYPGDAEFKRSIQQAVLRVPLRNTEGATQTITFTPIPDQPRTARSLKLTATSDAANSKVHFYVREGPAEIRDDTLTFTPLPPRTKLPVSVTVVAWQWGRSIEPKLQSAEPVESTFLILP